MCHNHGGIKNRLAATDVTEYRSRQPRAVLLGGANLAPLRPTWRIDMATILVLNGPNLNLLGSREPQHYGHATLPEIRTHLEQMAKAAGHSLSWFQSNAEHQLVDRVHLAAQEAISFIIINPAAFTHTSIALRDALLAVGIAFIEVHLSNVHARESFRHHSFFADIAIGQICGFGPKSYELALLAAIDRLTRQNQPSSG